MSEFVHPEDKLEKESKEAREKAELQERATRRQYRELHDSEEGITALSLELIDLGWLTTETTGGNQYLRDYANFIIRERIGIKTAGQLKQLVRFMLSIGQ